MFLFWLFFQFNASKVAVAAFDVYSRKLGQQQPCILFCLSCCLLAHILSGRGGFWLTLIGFDRYPADSVIIMRYAHYKILKDG